MTSLDIPCQGIDVFWNAFRKEKSGMVAGPATAILWSLCDLPKGLFRSKAVSQSLVILMRYSLFWIKYLDLLMAQNQTALDFASATYILGTKAEIPIAPESIVEKYQRKSCQ